MTSAPSIWTQLSEWIAAWMGLHFSAERVGDLRRGVAAAAREFGFDDPERCAEWLLAVPPSRAQLDVLARHLTVGETYFFREPRAFEVLTGHLLRELIDARRGGTQRLRLWSAACCSGEEAYSLAIAVHEMLPDLQEWKVTILGTDINPAFLRRAADGVYGEWSFRNAPVPFKARYFTRTSEGQYAIVPEIRRMVTFEHLNLVEDAYPSLATDTYAMDVIFCRNVLMYFSPEQAQKVVAKLHRALIDGGWLVVSPTEASRGLFPQFEVRNFPNLILYRKGAARVAASNARLERRASAGRATPEPRDSTIRRHARPAVSAEPRQQLEAGPMADASSLYAEGRYAEAADLLAGEAAGSAPKPEVFSLLTRSLANAGRLSDARTWCDRWVAAHKTDASAHYLRGMVLLEAGDEDAACRALQRALYLEPAMVVAHFALATLARSRARTAEAEKHVQNALTLLAAMGPDEPLPHADGLTAGRLKETLTAASARRSSA